MNNDKQQERLALARRLRQRGVSLEIPDDDDPSPHSPKTGLFIRQIKGRATQFNSFEVGYSIYLRIVNNLSSAFWISGFRLQLPWEDDNLFLLADRAEFDPPHTHYNFLSTPEPSFPRDEVVNHHRLYQLSRGHPLEGYLLWSGQTPIPEKYARGSHVEAFVMVLDQYWREYPEPLSLRVDRRGSRRVLRNRPRRSITGRKTQKVF